jgi:ketosteroid isomerase-like protein
VTAEDNRRLVERYFADCLNRLNGGGRAAALAVVDELMAPDFVMTYNNDPEPKGMHGTGRHKAFLVDHARAYRDDAWTLESIVADDATVACIWRIQATHATSGNAVDVHAADFFEVRGGRLARLRRFLDFEDLARQTEPSV